MAVLLLRISSPLQSWGISSKYERRDSHKEPTKSAIIGMIASAMGRKRNEDISDLSNGLSFGVRVDQQGELLVDYQMVKAAKPYITYRNYLSDAIFLVGLEGDISLIKEVEYALKNPYYPLFFGRRSCPPAGKLVIGIYNDTELEQCLKKYSCLSSKIKNLNNKMPLFIEAKAHEKADYFIQDKPISFNQNHRKFAYRGIKESYITRPEEKLRDNHDPLEVFGG